MINKSWLSDQPGAMLERIEAHYAEANRRLADLRPGLPLEELGYPLTPALPRTADSHALRTAP